MSLARGIYRALEDIVGLENISDEPAIVDSYAFQWMGELMPTGKGDRFAIRPEAVVLPGSTEEVRAVVKACNRYKIKFKAFSTGWGVFGGPGSEGVIQLDLRRMNRILEIDERNMYAVVEPYVIGAQLQAELMKRGLNCNIITAGSNVSALPLTALIGDGHSSVSTGVSGRNTLGVEWVLPTGDVLRLGSLGSGAGWFCGDGPGPSLRGVARGICASEGGLGVFTKAATKVYHWPGPPVPPTEIEGVSPSYTRKPLPETHCYYLFFPSWEQLAEAGIKIAESEIAYVLCGLPQYQLAADIATSNEEGAQLFSEILKSTKGLPGLLVIISAMSRREFDYQEKVLREIVAETRGDYLPLLEDNNIQGGLMWRFIRVSAGVRQYFRFTGGSTVQSLQANWDRTPGVRGEVNKKVSQEGIRKGLLFDDLGDGGICAPVDYGHMVVLGAGALFDPIDLEARQEGLRWFLEANKLGLEKYKYITSAIFAEQHDMIGPQQSNYQLWQRKIKKAFDPNVAADPANYINP